MLAFLGNNMYTEVNKLKLNPPDCVIHAAKGRCHWANHDMVNTQNAANNSHHAGVILVEITLSEVTEQLPST